MESVGKMNPDRMNAGKAVNRLACIACADVEETAEMRSPSPSEPVRKIALRNMRRVMLPITSTPKTR